MKLIASLILILITAQGTFAQSRAAKIDSICLAIHKQNPEIGMSIGFVDNEKEYYFNYGTISRKSKSEVNEQTIYPIGSLTKLFTANLIVQAQNEGKLNTEDFIDTYLPKDFILSKDIQKTIKISDLGSHQSGLPNFNFEQLIKENPKQPLDIKIETIKSILNDSLKLTDYGTYRYSNFGYVLLGIILEKVHAKEYKTLLTQKILEPAGMSATLTTDFNVKNKITGYDGQGVEQELWNWNDLSASAGLIKSNTRDMVKFIKNSMHPKNEIFSAAEITEKTLYKNTIREVGLGPQIKKNGEDVYYFKTGNTFSGSSIMAYDKISNWGLVILMNQQNLGLIDELMDSIYKKAL